VFWSDAPPPYAASLVFRVGRVDESLSTAGITHLVEHLALPAQAMRPELDWNGWVGPLEAGFWASGDEGDVLAFLGDVARRLGNLPLERFDRERRILHAEAASFSPGPVEALAALRFGAQGIGITNWQEFGLYRLNQEAVADWARQYFTAANAALSMTGPPPEDFRLDLASGTRVAPPEPSPLDVALPAFLKTGRGGVAISFLAERSWPLATARAAVSHRANTLLRYERAIVYGVEEWGDPLSAKTGHYGFVAECMDEHADEAARLLLEVLDEIASEGPSEEELGFNPMAFERDVAHTQYAEQFLFQAAMEELLGGQGENISAWLAEMKEVTPASAAQALRRALETAILVVPEDASDPPSPYRPYPTGSLTHMDGRKVSHKKILGRLFMKEHLAVSDEAIGWVGEESSAIKFSECEALVEWAGGELGMIGRDGSSLWFDPKLLKGGDDVRSLVLSKVGRDRFVPLDRPADEGELL
jgi:zinc protease